MSDYEFIMPWPPSVGSCWRAVRGRFILSKKGREYRVRAIDRLKELGLYMELIDCEVTVSLVLNPPTLHRYDVDNFNKALFDALSHGGFWVDDEQVVKLTVIKGVKTKGGNVEVKIKLIQK